MKRFFSTILVLLIASISNLYSTDWELVGTAGFNGGIAGNVSLAIDGNNVPYVGYQDNSVSNKATVKKYNGTNWITVGTLGFSEGNAEIFTLKIDNNNTPYVAYRDAGISNKIIVKKYNGSNWVTVGAEGFTNEIVYNIGLSFDNNNNPYVLYRSGNDYKLSVMKFNGTDWEIVGSPYFSSSYAQEPQLSIDNNNNLYVIYRDNDNGEKATVMKYNGNSWSLVGAAGFSTNNVLFPYISIDSDNIPYVAFEEQNKATVMKFNGTSWVLVGSAKFTSSNISYLNLAIDNFDTPYIVYTNETANKVSAMKFNGNDWEFYGRENISNTTSGSNYFNNLEFDNDNNAFVSTYYYSNFNGIISVYKFNAPPPPPPSITSVNVPNNRVYFIDDVLSFTVNFDYVVNVTGTPRIAITIGNSTKYATYQSGSNSKSLLFSYIVEAGDLDENGINVNNLELNGGAIKDASNNDANLTLNSVGTLSEVKVNGIGYTLNQMNKLVASDRGEGDNFGFSTSISGDYAVVGAYGDDEDASGTNTLSNAGSAYIFKRNGNTWTQQQKIVALDRTSEDYFGRAVSINGDYVIIGADGGDNGNLTGSAYIFKRIGTSWVQEAKIVASDRAVGDQFGYSVAISGDYAIVSAIYEDQNANGSNTLTNSGSAYIFKRSGTTWAQEAKIVASDRAANDSFGNTVSLSGDYAIVGAINEDEDANGINTQNNAGSAYIFKRSGTSWTQEAKIVASDRAANDYFSTNVSISGDYAIVGAYNESEDANGGNTKNSAGSAYIFKRNGTSWTQESKLVASDRTGGDLFGFSVSISGDYAIVGATQESEDANGANTLNSAGSVYIFKRSGTTWSQINKIVASDREQGSYFGRSIAISGDYIIVGTEYENEDANGNNTLSNAGSAYIFGIPEFPLPTLTSDDFNYFPKYDLMSPDGDVRDIVLDDDYIYIGGAFDRIGQNIGNIARLNFDNSDINNNLPHILGSQIQTMVSDDNGGWYVGSNGTLTINSVTKNHIAHILPDGTFDPNFNMDLNNYVSHIIKVGNNLYIAGAFQNAGPQNDINYLIKANATDGNIDNQFKPNPDQILSNLVYYNNSLIIEGDFLQISNTNIPYFAKMNGITGEVDTDFSSAFEFITDYGPYVTNLLIFKDKLAIGGYFTIKSTNSDSTRNHFTFMDPNTGEIELPEINHENIRFDGTVQKIAASEDSLYIFGYFEESSLNHYYGFSTVDFINGAVPNILDQDNQMDNFHDLVYKNNNLYLVGDFKVSSQGGPSGHFDYLNNTTTNQNSMIIKYNVENKIPVQSWNPILHGSIPRLALSDTELIVFDQRLSINSYNIINLARYNRTTKRLDLTWQPANTLVTTNNIDGVAPIDIYDMEINGNDLFFAGNFEFTALCCSTDVKNILSINKNTGLMDENSFTPSVNNSVTSIKAIGDDIYIGGSFTQVNFQEKKGVAKIYRNNALDDNFDLQLEENYALYDEYFYIYKIENGTGDAADSLYIAGNFMEINAQENTKAMVKVNRFNGSLDSQFSPKIDYSEFTENVSIYDFKIDGNDIFIAGKFDRINAIDQNNFVNTKGLAKINKYTGDANLDWIFDFDDVGESIDLEDNYLYFTGRKNNGETTNVYKIKKSNATFDSNFDLVADYSIKVMVNSEDKELYVYNELSKVNNDNRYRYFSIIDNSYVYVAPLCNETYEVTNTDDSGEGSLRYAIENLCEGGIITFSNTLSGEKLNLTTGQLTINKNMTIDASDLNEHFIIDGSEESRLMFVDNSTVNINKIKFINGKDDGFAGALWNVNSDLTLNNCDFEMNSAGWGGAISQYDDDGGLESKLTLDNCSFISNNSTNEGGAINIAAGSIYTINETDFRYNTTESNGGAVHINNGYGSFINSTFYENVSAALGGGVAINQENSTKVDIDNSTFEYNIANGTLSQGAGIYISNGELNINGTNINNNYLANSNSNYGAGIMIQGGTVNIGDSSKIFGNYHANDGAGIYLNSGTLNINGASEIYNNTSKSSGGGIFVNNSTVCSLNTVKIYNNIATNNSGAGIYVNNGTASLFNCEVYGNTANNSRGGGIMSKNSATLNIDNTSIYNNSAKFGGGYYADNSTQNKLRNVTFYNNAALNGGGLMATSSANVILTNNTIYGNSVTGTGNAGGGILNNPSGNASISARNTIITNNTSTNDIGNDIFGNFTDNDYNLIQDTNDITITPTTLTENGIYGVSPLFGYFDYVNDSFIKVVTFLEGSANINNGSNEKGDNHSEDISLQDALGNETISETKDMGAFEYNKTIEELSILSKSVNQYYTFLIAEINFTSGTRSNYGFVLSTNRYPTKDNSIYTSSDLNFNNMTYSKVIGSLNPSTTYYVRAFSQNGEGYGYSREIEFTTPAPAPTTQSKSITFHSITKDRIGLRWTKGNGENRIILASTGTLNASTYLTNGTNYFAGNYGVNACTTNVFVVYNGNNTTCLVEGLTRNTTYYFRIMEYNGSGKTSNYLQSTATGNPSSKATSKKDAEEDEVTISQVLNVYPNPVKDFVNIELNTQITNGKLTIINEVGQEVYNTDNLNNNLNINTTNYAKGVYHILITSEEETIYHSFVIER